MVKKSKSPARRSRSCHPQRVCIRRLDDRIKQYLTYYIIIHTHHLRNYFETLHQNFYAAFLPRKPLTKVKNPRFRQHSRRQLQDFQEQRL